MSTLLRIEKNDVERIYSIIFMRGSGGSDELNTAQKKQMINQECTKQLIELFSGISNQIQSNDSNSKLEADERPNINSNLPFKQSSTLNRAGQGIFVGSRIEPGRVIAIYGGVVFSQAEIPIVSNFVFVDNDYLYSRLDGDVIDGCDSKPFSKQAFNSSFQRQLQHNKRMKKTSPCTSHNPYAVAQFANHAAEEFANSIMFDYEFHSDDFGEHLWPFIPNIHFSASQSPNVIKTALLISTKTIESGQEIFFDYRFNLKNQSLPQWYTNNLKK